MFAILMALPLLHVKQTAPATHPCSRRPTRTGLSNGRLHVPSMLSIHARHVRPPSSCTLSGKMQQELSCLEGRLLEGRPALGIVLLTESTV